MAWDSPIIRVSTGKLNTVNETVIAGQAGMTGASKFGGQLGKAIWLDSSQVAGMFSSTIGTLYGGAYRYVKLSSASTPAIVRGQILFWDNAAAENAYQVTAVQTTTTLVASSIAGVALNVITAGNYGFIQVAGIASIKYRGTITGTAASGRPVVVSVAGGADLGLGDIVDTAGIEPIQVGWAIDTPVAGSTLRVNLNNFLSLRA